MTLDNLQFIISSLTLLGFVFVAYRTFREPDIKADKAIDILKEQIKAEKEISLQSLKTIQNDLHALGYQVDENRKEIKDLGVNVVKLQTIIEERIPRLKK